MFDFNQNKNKKNLLLGGDNFCFTTLPSGCCSGFRFFSNFSFSKMN